MTSRKSAPILSWQAIEKIWLRNFFVFQKTWTISAFWILLEPLFILSALGFGLGSFINNVQGVPYVDFFFPALLCNSAMMVTYFSSTYDYFSKLRDQRLYITQVMTPIEPAEIALGEILWTASKGTLSAVVVALVGFAMGLIDGIYIVPVIFVIFVMCLFFAALGMLITCKINNYDQITYPTSGFIIPMSLFSGTYFPIEQMPYGLKYLAYAFPLTHAVKIARGFFLQGFDWIYVLHFVILLVIVIYFVRWALRRLQAKLVQ